jgi:tetratricopeptide (TPR) repeat protein
MRPLCFILMPFGQKPVIDGRIVDFDAVYEELIKPAVMDAGLEPLRADEEITGGVIHKAMFERLVLCEYAVADLTSANANVFYELGIRHSVRPWATQLIFAKGWGQLPFDVGLLRAMPYELGRGGKPIKTSLSRSALTERIKAAMQATTDSPLFQMLDGFPTPDIARLKTDVFRDRIVYAEDIKTKIAKARRDGERAIEAIETELGDISHADAAVVVDLFLSYRAVKSWERMISLVERMAPPLSAAVLVREQLGFALNRIGRSDDAERILKDLIEERGASSETYGILGRVYKDRWEEAVNSGNRCLAQGLLDQAITAYLKGFEADWRDAYPGINAVTLMEVRTPPDPRQSSILPVVRYSNERRIIQGQPDYWDYATQLELAVLGRDQVVGESALANALALVRESWEPETTTRNLALIRGARMERGETLDWANSAEEELLKLSVK